MVADYLILSGVATAVIGLVLGFVFGLPLVGVAVGGVPVTVGMTLRLLEWCNSRRAQAISTEEGDVA